MVGRRWSDLSLRSKGLTVMALPLTALLLASFSFWVSQQRNERAQESVASSLALKTQLGKVLSLVVDAETGVRGWLITGQERFLEPYFSARRGVPTAMRRLRELEARDPTQGPRVAHLASLVDSRLASSEEIRRHPRLDGGAPPEVVAMLEAGKAETDRVRSQISAMESTEDDLLAQRRRDAERAHDRAVVTLLGSLGVGLGGGVAGALLFTRGVARRVALVEEGARRLAEGEDFADLPKGADEVGRLGESLRRAGQLLHERERERDALSQAQQEAREAAEAANRSKSEFLSRMSHELRTPLNAVLGFGQLLQLDELSVEQRDSARQIVNAGGHLLDLINEVLDISRIETGQLTLSLEPVSIAEVAEESLDLVRPLAAHRGLRFPDGPPAECASFVRADRQRLKQVLVNLLANAVKYNRKDGEIHLDCRPGSEGKLRISVTDSGPGIAAEKLELLFRPFERLGAEQSEVEGTGLGLALAQRLMEAMGGTIGVETEVGTGSTFCLELDKADAPAEMPVAVPADPVTQQSSRHPKTLLYIEDNVANIKLVERILERRPEVRLLVAMEGELGLELAARHRPDLVLLDLNLPDMSGEVVLQRMKAEPASRDIPVVVVSADAMPRQIAQLRAIGASRYLTKPFLVSEFLSVIDSAGTGGAVPPEDAPASPPGGEPTQAFESVLDPMIVASLRELQDDTGSLADLRITFAQTARDTLDDLDDALQRRDGEAVRALAHRLKGSAASMGAHRMARMCRELEQHADGQLDVGAASATLAGLRPELEAVLAALTEVLP